MFKTCKRQSIASWRYELKRAFRLEVQVILGWTLLSSAAPDTLAVQFKVAAGGEHTVGLRSYARLVTARYSSNGQCNLSRWSLAVPNSEVSVLEIYAFDPSASEGGDGGNIETTRTGNFGNPLVVVLGVRGTATNAQDYLWLTGSVTIPAWLSSIKIKVKPIGDSIKEYSEVVRAKGRSQTIPKLPCWNSGEGSHLRHG
jgi:hypothetical protein